MAALKLQIKLAGSVIFLADTFPCTLYKGTTSVADSYFVKTTSNTASGTFSVLAGTSYSNIVFYFSNNYNSSNVTNINQSSDVTDVGSITSTNTTLTPSTVNLGYTKLGTATDSNSYVSSQFSFTAACLHGNSLVTTENGPIKIKDLKINEKILTGDNEYAKVLDVVQCWLKIPDHPYHNCIIFEPNSLGDKQPSEKLIIDPGHPICLLEEYKKNGIDALKRAGEFVNENNEQIYVSDWSDPSLGDDIDIRRRYDIVLESPYKTYIANNIVIMARESSTNAGYLHLYDNYV
jgi:hypothetical protein